jgi:hypothetical protein
MRVYEELKGRFSELEARLEILDRGESQTASQPLQNKGNDENDLYNKEVLKKAKNAKCDLVQSLFHNHSGTEWTFGVGLHLCVAYTSSRL